MWLWRQFLNIVDLFERIPFLLLGLVVLVLAGANYRTLMEALPSSVPEVDNFLASVAPKIVTIEGSLTGVEHCWRMDFTFFAEDGSKLLATLDHIARVTNQKPQTTIELPYRKAYKMRLQTEVYLSDPETCFIIGSGPILRSRSVEMTLAERAVEIAITNTCDFTQENNCDLVIE